MTNYLEVAALTQYTYRDLSKTAQYTCDYINLHFASSKYSKRTCTLLTLRQI